MSGGRSDTRRNHSVLGKSVFGPMAGCTGHSPVFREAWLKEKFLAEEGSICIFHIGVGPIDRDGPPYGVLL